MGWGLLGVLEEKLSGVPRGCSRDIALALRVLDCFAKLDLDGHIP